MNDKEILEIILSRYVTFVGGRYSRGKSLILTFLTLMDIILNNRKNIYSNMPLNFDNSGFNTNIKHFVDTAFFDNLPSHSNFIWDEMTNDISARGFATVKNKFISIIGVDIAKKDDRLRGTFQFGDTVDKIMGLYCECIIIPEYVNIYSDNTKEDNIKRVENKDFLQHWIIIDKRDNDKRYELTLNLYPVIFFYNTKFKPFSLLVNHEEYIERMKPKTLEIFREKEPSEINKRISNWLDGLMDIGKVMIR